MNQLELREEAIICSRKIREASLQISPFKHTVIDNFLNTDLANKAMEAFPPLSDPCWEHSKDEGIEVKSRTAWTSEFDIPEKIVDVVRNGMGCSDRLGLL